MKELKNILAIAFGLAFLWIPCLLRAWGPAGTTNKVWQFPYEYLNGRPIDGWTWKWLWPWFHNPEDGDSGITALIWVDGKLTPYNPTGSRWKAYCWSAWRNNADGLKYQ